MTNNSGISPDLRTKLPLAAGGVTERSLVEHPDAHHADVTGPAHRRGAGAVTGIRAAVPDAAPERPSTGPTADPEPVDPAPASRSTVQIQGPRQPGPPRDPNGGLRGGT